MHFKEAIQVARTLGKFRISLPVSLSALAGFVLSNGNPDALALMLATAVFLMSCGSATINHIQESNIDRLMSRTRNRPIPSGQISVRGAWLVAGIYLFTGSVILLWLFPPIAFLLSLITLLWYNLIYTPLKKVTAFAVIPGSVTGALPPVIGWVAAGGSITDPGILLVAAFFFIGQIPHFWLLLLMFGDQYREAGLPTLNHLFSPEQIRRITFVWILATLSAALLVLGYVFSQKAVVLPMLAYIFYLVISLVIRLINGSFQPKSAFFRLNLLYLFMMIALIAEGILRN